MTQNGEANSRSMASVPKIAVLVMAAGSGSRAGGDQPKQFRRLGGIPLLTRTEKALREALPDAEIYRVVAPDTQPIYFDDGSIVGGRVRQESVRLGLEALCGNPPDIVLIHDAARPFVSPGLVTRLLGALDDPSIDGVAPGLPVIDSLKSCDSGGVVAASVSRDGLWMVQTPQIFRYAPILAAHRDAAGLELTDDLSVGERAGLQLRLVQGDEANFKITMPEDFDRAERMLASTLTDIRQAQGFDVHAFSRGDHLMLCGVRIAHSHGLDGHSDADVGLHAITDALLGCIGAGDIGSHFPPSDSRWQGADSSRFLSHAAELVTNRGGMIAHIDVTLICEAPKIGPHREAMIRRIADILQLDRGRVSVKATTTERLGFTGRREGIAALSSATVRLP